MRFALRLWILCVVISIFLYYVHLQKKEPFSSAVITDSKNNLGSNVGATRETACAELGTLRTFFLNKVGEMRSSMKNLSGTQKLAVKLKDETMRFQYQFSDSCTQFVNDTSFRGVEKIPRDACIDLASQDDPISGTLLPNYDTTNLSLYKQEIRILDNLQTINDTIKLTGCAVSDFTFDADRDVGTINTEELRAKLNELSPYYISSGTLDFVTLYLVGNGILDTALYTSSEILKSVNQSLGYIKTKSDPMFK